MMSVKNREKMTVVMPSQEIVFDESASKYGEHIHHRQGKEEEDENSEPTKSAQGPRSRRA